ncbi:hypothetical protein, partial [Streptomyces albidochromogenes]
MIKAKRVLAVAALAAGVSALAAPTASAADSGYLLSVPDELDKLGSSAVPVDRRSEVPTVTDQLKGLGQLHKLGELQQVTGLAAPLTGLVPEMG